MKVCLVPRVREIVVAKLVLSLVASFRGGVGSNFDVSVKVWLVATRFAARFAASFPGIVG